MGVYLSKRILFFNFLVFPTHVGVYLPASRKTGTQRCFPHARGGVPIPIDISGNGNTFSPRTWGCTSACAILPIATIVFPTHVGVYRVDHHVFAYSSAFSPRTWGCTVFGEIAEGVVVVFPTHVGVYLIASWINDYLF